MGKLVEMTHVTLGGQIDALEEWALPFLDQQHNEYSSRLLNESDAVLLGRVSYEGMSDAYLRMAEQARPGTPVEFIKRMNEIPKFVASTTLEQVSTWNATRIDGDVAEFVAGLKDDRDLSLVKYGTGILDVAFMKHGLVDEFHLSLSPVAAGHGARLFEHFDQATRLELQEVNRFDSGVLVLVYTPR